MAKNEFELKINVSGNAEKSIGDLKKELREAKQELQQAEKGTEQWYNALKRTAAIKDEIEDINKAVSLTTNGFQGLNATMNVIAGGIQGIASVTAILGSENEALTKTLIKLQAAANFAGAVAQLKDLGVAFQALRATLLTNPLFIVASVITAIGVAIYAIRDRFEFLIKMFDAIGEGISRVADAIGLINRKVEALDKIMGEFESKNKEAIATIERQMKIAEAEGKSTIELQKQKIELQKDYIAKQIAILRLKELEGKLSDEERKKLGDLRQELVNLSTEQIAMNIKQNKEIEEQEKKAQEQRKEQYRKYIENKKKQDKEAFDNAVALLEFEKAKAMITAEDKALVEFDFISKKKKLILESNAFEAKEKEKLIDELNRQQELLLLQQQVDMEKQREVELKALFERKMEQMELEKQLALESNDDRLATELEFLERKRALVLEAEGITELERIKLIEKIDNEIKLNKIKQAKDIAAKELEIEKQKEAAKKQVQQLSLQAIDSLSNAFFTLALQRVAKGSEEEKKLQRVKFNIDKGINIAKAVMNTAEGVTKALAASPPPINAILAGITAAMGAAQVAVIAAQQFPESEGAISSNVPSISGGGGAVSETQTQPLQPILPQGIDTANIQRTDEQVIKAVVVETDITEKQRRVKNIIESSSF